MRLGIPVRVAMTKEQRLRFREQVIDCHYSFFCAGTCPYASAGAWTGCPNQALGHLWIQKNMDWINDMLGTYRHGYDQDFA